MITNPIAFKKNKLIREIISAQKQSGDLLYHHNNHADIAHLIYAHQGYKQFLLENPSALKIPLEELKEKHEQVFNLLEQAKNL
ncbi:hypothetical protein JC777_00485 (plasmid) [Bacillus cytotoxicus]|uniref:Uncharacterized protein n=1 Tax=Bacillus cytotoxicus TaxID=580165 RepID=A0AAX2CKE6_9BACI|nr:MULTISPECIES: hypothetical protein [Bacillus cereus group]MDH2880981.1 hypothetical protein [Bacillus cytotoxicus]QTR81131.1 hypothetical protein JC777_00485 [Bacillus cytotoxicus]QTR87970.1 hypothetical protein JC774_05470 [Bacillus cytotoxicus]SCM00309.1 Uncharacterized protein BCB44BAC_03295 [Bacillus cytotoxicus]HDR4572242.1 hypothetical protein [Bacillus cytotoxicus]